MTCSLQQNVIDAAINACIHTDNIPKTYCKLFMRNREQTKCN